MTTSNGHRKTEYDAKELWDVVRLWRLTIMMRNLDAQNAFEIVSIHRLNTSGEEGHGIKVFRLEEIHRVNVTAKTLILYAFDIKDFQLAGTPGWIDSEGYDIEAKVAAQNGSQPNPARRRLVLKDFGRCFGHCWRAGSG